MLKREALSDTNHCHFQSQCAVTATCEVDASSSRNSQLKESKSNKKIVTVCSVQCALHRRVCNVKKRGEEGVMVCNLKGIFYSMRVHPVVLVILYQICYRQPQLYNTI
jgi:hypothetical protein